MNIQKKNSELFSYDLLNASFLFFLDYRKYYFPNDNPTSPPTSKFSQIEIINAKHKATAVDSRVLSPVYTILYYKML